jgi:two-component system response regulator NreC
MLSKVIVSVTNGETFFDPNMAFNFINSYIDDHLTLDNTSKIILSNKEKKIKPNCKRYIF